MIVNNRDNFEIILFIGQLPPTTFDCYVTDHSVYQLSPTTFDCYVTDHSVYQLLITARSNHLSLTLSTGLMSFISSS